MDTPGIYFVISRSRVQILVPAPFPPAAVTSFLFYMFEPDLGLQRAFIESPLCNMLSIEQQFEYRGSSTFQHVSTGQKV